MQTYRKALGVLLAAVLMIGLAFLVYTYRVRVRLALDVLVLETGSNTAAAICVLLAIFTLVCALCWMLLPILLYLGLNDLRRRLLELEDATRLCARHLARLTDSRELSEEKKTAAQPPPSRSGS